MRTVKLQLMIGFLFLGVVLLGVSFYFSKKAELNSTSDLPLAQASRETGKVTVFHAGPQKVRENISRRTAIYGLGSIETSEDGSSVVSMENGDRISILGNSLVTLEKADPHETFSTILIIKKGDIRVESISKVGELAIAKNGERVSAHEYMKSQLASAKTQIEPALDTFSSSLSEENIGLSENEIADVMARQKNSFFKCYTQMLQKEPTQKGEVSLSFTIETSGKLSMTEVTASTIDNKPFKDCLLEVLRRTEFKPFHGMAISTVFPLKFE